MNSELKNIFYRVPVQKRNIALCRLLDAAVDANNRQLECVDRGHDNMAVFYTSIFLLCMLRLRTLAGLLDDPLKYYYFKWNNVTTQISYCRLLAEVRQWRWKWSKVKPLGRVPTDYS